VWLTANPSGNQLTKKEKVPTYVHGSMWESVEELSGANEKEGISNKRSRVMGVLRKSLSARRGRRCRRRHGAGGDPAHLERLIL